MMVENKAEELLRLGRTIKAQQHRIEAKLRELDAYDGYCAANMDGMPRGASVGRDAQIVEQRTDLQRSWQDLKVLLEGVKPYIRKLIKISHSTHEDGFLADVCLYRFAIMVSYQDIACNLFGESDFKSIRYVKDCVEKSVSRVATGIAACEVARLSEDELLRSYGYLIRRLSESGNLKTKFLFCEKIPCTASLDGE